MSEAFSASDFAQPWLSQFKAADQVLAAELLDSMVLVSADNFRNRLSDLIQECQKAVAGPVGLYVERELTLEGGYGQPERLFLENPSRPRRSFGVCRELNKSVPPFYAEANEYGPSHAEYLQARKGIYPRPTIQVYSGVGGVVRARRLASVALQGEPTALFAFMSMNEVLTQALINCLSPSRLFLINGRPPLHSWREAATAWIHEELRSEWPERDNPMTPISEGVDLPERVTSTLDYTDTLEVLLDLYWKYAADYRIVLTPTGSKMQAVACYVAKGIHPDIHVEYPTPQSFLPEYSRGIGNRWVVKFGALGTLLDQLRTQRMADHLMVLRNSDGII